MTRQQEIGRCDTCGKTFGYYLVHNGFNDSMYAYCDTCGITCFLSTYRVPSNVKVTEHGSISKDIEPLLRPCKCGGHFTRNATPRCPHCSAELSAIKATEFIEANAEGTKVGWRWQRSWVGLYCLVIENNLVEEQWK